VDAYGTELSHADSFEEVSTDFTNMQRVATPIGSVDTLYPSIGDAVGNVMLVGLVGLVVGLWLTRKVQVK
jgi:hypothetical protein